MPAIRTEGYTINPGNMSSESLAKLRVNGGIPQAKGFVLATGNYMPTIRTEADAVDLVHMSREG
jgi:hypothetical protein